MEDDEDFDALENDNPDDDFDQISIENSRLQRKRRVCYKGHGPSRVRNICSSCRKNCCDSHSTRVCKDCWLKNKRQIEIANRRNLRNFDVEDQSESESDDLE